MSRMLKPNIFQIWRRYRPQHFATMHAIVAYISAMLQFRQI